MDKTLIDDIAKAGLMPAIRRPPGFGITAEELGENKNISVDAARNALKKAVKLGILEEHRVTIGLGTPKLIFCRIGEWPPK